MSNLYTNVEKVKAAMSARGGVTIAGPVDDAAIFRLIEQVSRGVDNELHTRLIPITETRKLPWSRRWVRGHRLFFDADLISVTTLKDRGGDRTLTEGTHFILQPENAGPPYSWAEWLLSTAGTFESGSDTLQQSFEIAGQWASYSATEGASSLAAAIADATATTLQVKDGSKIGVGDTPLIESEQLFVSARADVDLAVNLSANLTKDDSDETVTLGDPADDLLVGEVIRIGSERMLVTAVNSATSVEVRRAYDGTTLAAHTSGADIFVYRSFTVQRGENGTTAASHADDTAVSRYVVPPEVEELVIAEVVAAFQQQRAGWGRTVGAGDRQAELSGRALSDLRKRIMPQRRRHLMESI